MFAGISNPNAFVIYSIKFGVAIAIINNTPLTSQNVENEICNFLFFIFLKIRER